MDPRIRHRRIAVKRDEGRRRLHILIASVAVIALVVGAVAATRSPLLDVDHVVVEGAEHTTIDQVVAVTRLGSKPQLIDVGTSGLAKRVRALPWVASAEAERQWPATVRIRVVERAPTASIEAEGGRWAVVDRTGRVLEVLDQRPATMPSVGGVGLPGPAGSRLGPSGRDAMAVAAALPEVVRGITTGVVVNEEGEIDLHVTPAAIVKLGDASQLADKMQAIATMLGGAAGKGWRVLDVRVPRAPVLTRR
jgi:cell division protein FtsQ